MHFPPQNIPRKNPEGKDEMTVGRKNVNMELIYSVIRYALTHWRLIQSMEQQAKEEHNVSKLCESFLVESPPNSTTMLFKFT